MAFDRQILREKLRVSLLDAENLEEKMNTYEDTDKEIYDVYFKRYRKELEKVVEISKKLLYST